MEAKQVAGYKTRTYMLYDSNVEYADLAMNHVMGCGHGCTYCYMYKGNKRWGKVKNMEQWVQPILVSNTLELLAKEIPKLKRLERIPTVYLSLGTDAFMYGYPEIIKMSLDSIAMLNNAGIPCVTLTKGVLPPELSYLSKQNLHGITLTSLDESFRMRMEPEAAPYSERLISLKYLHDMGLKTWVSIEPFFTPNIVETDLLAMLHTIGFVDKIVFGRANYVEEINEYPNYKEYFNYHASIVKDFCWQRGIEVHIKDKTITPHSMCDIV